MKRLAAVALAVGVITASCSGHGGGSMLPAAGTQSHNSHLGTGQTRIMSVATAPSGWSATGTQAMPLKSATDLGALSSTQPMTVRVGLQMRNASQLEQLVASGGKISESQFVSEYAPTSAQVGAAVSYLQSQGFSNIQTEPNNMLVSADGTAATVEKAFNTSLHSFTQNGVNVFANVSPAYVPASLNGIAVAVLGLNDVKAASIPHVVETEQPCANPVTGQPSPTTDGILCLRSFDPQSFWNAYDVGSTPTGAQTTVAVMAEGNVSSAITDLRMNEQAFGLPQVPVTVVPVGLASPDTSGNDEWALDMSYSTGMAGNVSHLYLYDTTSLTDSDITLEYSKWVSQDVAQLGNSSFGGCEAFPYLDGSMLMDDMLFLEGAAQGQTMFASSGDTGSFCSVGTPNGVNAGAPLVEYPASSPYDVAVGGTSLLTYNIGTYKGEAGWNNGGGGISQFEYSPYWEQGVQPQETSAAGESSPESIRGVPDVAMDADPNVSGAILYLDPADASAAGCTSPCVIGGTSLSSPLAMGVYARLQSAHGNALGFAAPLFYKVYVENPNIGTTYSGPPPTDTIGGFHDILTGNNTLYSAGPRWDYITGLGSFDVSLMNGIIGQ